MKRIISLFLIIIMLIPSFNVMASDYEAHWAKAYIDALVQEKIVQGDSEGMRPDDTLLRCEFIKIINKTFGYTLNNENIDFIDVYPQDWYYTDVMIGVQRGYIKGDNSGKISPLDNITRGEMATMLGRILGENSDSVTPFKDNDYISEWAKGAINSLCSLGFISGYEDNTFRADDNLLRAEGFTVMSKIIDKRFESGQGSKKDPYIIAKPYQLNNIKFDLTGNYKLSNDLDFIETNINFDALGTADEPFNGTFDGNGNKIIGIETKLSSKNVLFDTIGEDGRVSNLRIVCPFNFFSVSRTNNGLIENCANTSFDGQQTQFSSYKGSIAGTNNGHIYNCYNTSKIDGRVGDKGVGGIAGINNGNIGNCFNTGNSEFNGAAGIAGINNGLIDNSFNIGLLTGTGSQPITNQNGKGVVNCAYLNNMFSVIGQKSTYEGLFELYKDDIWSQRKYNKIPTLSSLTFMDNENFTQFYGGDGSLLNPYKINSDKSFDNIRKFLDSNFIQIKDIDLSDINFNEGYGFEPISNFENKFTGTYNGNGKLIYGLKISRGTEDDISLFGWNMGEIRNVNITNSYIEGNRNVASIAARNSGLIYGCSSSAKIVGRYGAGLVGMNSGENSVIDNSYFQGKVSARQIGAGIAIQNEGGIVNSYSIGQVAADLSCGIAGTNYGLIESTYNAGELLGNDIGGLVGDNYGSIYSSYYLEGTEFANGEQGENENIVKRSLEQMPFESSFSHLNFTDTWVFKNGYSFPQLKSNSHITLSLKENITDFAGGLGTVDNPYRIVTPLQFNNVRKYPNSSFVLMNNLDMTQVTSKDGVYYNNGLGFEPIKLFSGIFDGDNHKITGLSIKRTEFGGLFQVNEGVISDLYLENSNIIGEIAGGICSVNKGAVIGCKNTAVINGKISGGISGQNIGVIATSANGGKVWGSEKASGISADNIGSIVNSFNTGIIVGKNESSFVAGISLGKGKIDKTYSVGLLTFESKNGVLFPISDGEYDDSYYLNSSNDFQKGSRTYTQMTDLNQINGFDFEDIWTMGVKCFPVINKMNLDNLQFPSTFVAGDGSEENPYVITTASDLNNIKMYRESNFILGRDIDLTNEIKTGGLFYNGGLGFEPIGDETNPFTGSLDGNGHIIAGLEIVRNTMKNVGLFGVSYGKIQNVNMTKCRIEGKENAGIIAGLNEGSITNIAVNGRVGSADNYAGGIVGINKSGGLIQYCYNYSDVFASSYTGGIVGLNNGVTMLSVNMGGVVTTSVDSEAASGGISGINTNVVSQSVNNGKIFSYSDTGTAMSGGIVGVNESIVSNSYNTGETISKSRDYCYSGGIIGYGRKNMDVSFVYNIGYGAATGNFSNVGSLMGGGENGRIRDSFYEHTLNSPVASGNVSIISVHALAEDKMMGYENFRGYDFEKVWFMQGNTAYAYPELIKIPHISVTFTENIKDFAGGNGTLENPYKIMTPEQLNNVRKYLGSTFILMGDIDMSAYCQNNNFQPIGDSIFSFFGMFLGNNYKITGLKIESDEYGGLFRQNHGEIYNLGVEDSVSDCNILGNITSINTGLIYKCYNLSDININNPKQPIFAGGLVGVNKYTGMIISSYNKGNITLNGDSSQAGGIVYGNYGVIAGSYNGGKIDIKGNKMSIGGGISGYNYGTISDSYNQSPVSSISQGSGEGIGGGISGTSGKMIVNCFNISDVVLAKTYGSIVGNGQNGETVNCYYNNKLDKGIGIGKEKGIYSKSEYELKQKDTFVDFDFENMWHIETGEYPKLFEIDF